MTTDRPAPSASRVRWAVAFLVVAVGVAASRAVWWYSPPTEWDTGYYAEFATVHLLAQRAGLSLSDYNDRLVSRRQFLKRHDPGAGGAELQWIEYPPLAIGFLALVGRLVDPAVRAALPRAAALDVFPAVYERHFHRVLAGADVIGALLVAFLARRLHPADSPARFAERMLLYAASTAVLWNLLYDRLDLVLVVLVLTALAALAMSRGAFWPMLTLAVAIDFKFAPIVLAPLWIVGTLPAEGAHSLHRPATWRALVKRALLLAAACVLLLAPFLRSDGLRCFDFLRYHRLRGLEVGSTWTPVACLLSGADAVEVYPAYGGLNVRSPWTAPLLTLSSVLTVGALVAALVVLWRGVWNWRLAATGGRTLGQLNAANVAVFAALFLSIPVALGKVFSPQYLLWFAPLAALLPARDRTERLQPALLLGACVLTTWLFPYHFWTDLVGPPLGADATDYRGPTAAGLAVLAMRNTLFLLWTVLLARSAWRSS